MKYLITKSTDIFSKEEVAKGVSKSMWNIKRPIHLRDENNITQFMLNVINHPVNKDEWAIYFDENKLIKKHNEADNNEFDLFLNQELSRISLCLYLTANEYVSVHTIIGHFGEIKDESFMRSNGWIE